MSLRKTFTIFAIALIVLTLSASSALIVVVGELHSVATSLDEALESVRIAKQLRIELLEADVLTRSGTAQHGPAVASSEASLPALLDEASSHLQSGDEGRLLARARERIDAFLDAARGPNRAAVGPSLEAAHGALRDLVEYNVALARTARRDANRLDRTAGRVGVIVAALIVAGALACLLWARRNVLAPILDLRTGIARFANRDRAVRLQPHGPAELQQVASTFNAMADELARQREERLSMLGGVAHDLRNPLSVLRVATSAFSPERDLPPESRLRGVLSLVHRQVTRLDRMVGDFLDASQLEAGALELRLEDADLRDVIEHVAELYRSAEPKREIVVSTPGHMVMARCDPARVEQALGNLLSNAIKYSPEGRRVGVTLSETGEREEIVLAVEDQGVGLSEEDVRRMFEPFCRVGPLRDRVPGVGLGLATASKIISSHGGRIGVTSTPGHGSRFEIRLPASPIATAARSESSATTVDGPRSDDALPLRG